MASNLTPNSEEQPAIPNPQESNQNVNPAKEKQAKIFTLITQWGQQILDNIKKYLAQGLERLTMTSFNEAMKQLQGGSTHNHCLLTFLQAVETGAQKYVEGFDTTDTPTQLLPGSNIYTIQDQINQEIKAIKEIAGMA